MQESQSLPIGARAVGSSPNLSPYLAHLNQAFPEARTYTEPPAQLDAAALSDLLDEVDQALIVCSEHGRIVMANDAGRRELLRKQPVGADARGGLLVLDDGGLGLAQCRTALRSAICQRRRQLLTLGEGEGRLMVAVVPLGRRSLPLAVLVLGRRQAAPSLALEMLCQQCGVTRSEREVLAELLAGQRVESIAKRREVSVSTVRTQVNFLRAKLSASRLEDLVRIAAELPPMASALRTQPASPVALLGTGLGAEAAA